MRVRRVLVVTVGLAQGAIGMLAVILAGALHLNLLGAKTTIDIPTELLPLYLLILGVFGFFSVMSGFFLIDEGTE